MLSFLNRAISRKSDEAREDLVFRHSPSPEIDRLRRTIYESGCVVVRGLIPKADIDLFADLAERSYDSCRQLLRILEISDDEPLEALSDARLRSFVSDIRIGQITSHYFSTVNAGHSMFDLLIGDAKRKAFVVSLLGGEWGPGAAIIRRVSPVPEQQSKSWQAPIVMHCDGPHLSRHTYSLNFWVSTVDCPGEVPGLQLVPGPFLPMQKAVKHDWETNTIDQDLELEMQKLYSSRQDGRPRFVPQLERGDVLIFHNWIVHGSYVTPAMTRPRTSFELRFNAPTRQHFEAFAA
jgi:hypothetical protein